MQHIRITLSTRLQIGMGEKKKTCPKIEYSVGFFDGANTDVVSWSYIHQNRAFGFTGVRELAQIQRQKPWHCGDYFGSLISWTFLNPIYTEIPRSSLIFSMTMQQYPNPHYKVGCYKSHPFGIHTISLWYIILAESSTKLQMDYLRKDYMTNWMVYILKSKWGTLAWRSGCYHCQGKISSLISIFCLSDGLTLFFALLLLSSLPLSFTSHLAYCRQCLKYSELLDFFYLLNIVYTLGSVYRQGLNGWQYVWLSTIRLH